MGRDSNAKQKCLTILDNCHRAMRPASKLLVIESVIPPRNEPFLGKIHDLHILLVPGGKEQGVWSVLDAENPSGLKLMATLFCAPS